MEDTKYIRRTIFLNSFPTITTTPTKTPTTAPITTPTIASTTAPTIDINIRDVEELEEIV